jgi:phosphate transport system substrate-binding protein
MAPLISQIATRFMAESGAKVRIAVSTGGSSKGIADARSGSASIGMASRGLNDSEKDLRGYPIARDGIGLVVHRSNPLQDLTDAQVAAIYSGAVTRWDDLHAGPGAIHALTRADGRSEVELFLKFFQLPKESVRAAAALGENTEAIEAVVSDPQAIIYVSVGEAERRAKAGAPIRMLPIHGVAASSETIRSGDYPLSRPLTLVVRGQPPPAANRFLQYCLSSRVSDLILKNDFVPYLD